MDFLWKRKNLFFYEKRKYQKHALKTCDKKYNEQAS